MPDTAVYMIRAFEGPRHERLESIWARIEQRDRAKVAFSVYENEDGRCHADCLNEIWQTARKDAERYALFTEFDFLPYPTWLGAKQWLDAEHPVVTANYVTRNPVSKTIEVHGKPGAWYMLVDKENIGDLDFTAGGAHNDPANELSHFVRRQGKAVHLLGATDCYPRHWGCQVNGAGEHLFWSRHYNDDPALTVAGFPLRDILRGVDHALDDYEETL